MDRVRHDITIALRGFRRSPSFTVTAVLILAIGIGMAVAMFTVFDAVVLRPLPSRIPIGSSSCSPTTAIRTPTTTSSARTSRRSPPRARPCATSVASRTGARRRRPMVDGDRPLVLNRTLVTGNFFDVLGARPLLGRLLQPSDEVRRRRARDRAELLGVAEAFRAAIRPSSDDKLVEPYGRKPYRDRRHRAARPRVPGRRGSLDARLAAVATACPSSRSLGSRLTPRRDPPQAEFLTTMRQLSTDRDYDGVHVETFTHAVVGDVQPVLARARRRRRPAAAHRVRQRRKPAAAARLEPRARALRPPRARRDLRRRRAAARRRERAARRRRRRARSRARRRCWSGSCSRTRRRSCRART